MYIDNQNGFNTPAPGFQAPGNAFAQPAPGFQNGAGYAAPAGFQPAAPQAAPVSNYNNYEDGDFIDGWEDDDFDFSQNAVQIKVFGVGGGGCNAVNCMYLSGEKNAEMIVVNTDIAALKKCPVKKKVCIGKKITRGHGAGGNPEIGKKSAEDSIEFVKKHLTNVDMIYITAGMGGGTGTGAAPIIATAAKQLGILTVAVVTKPFVFEGQHRMNQAEDGIAKLRQCCDAVIVVPNEKLLTVSGEKPLGLKEAFQAANEVLIKSVQSVCRLINEESDINLDFADVTTVLRNSGYAHIGVGIGHGEDMAAKAAAQAINSPLLETTIKDADGIIISVISNDSLPITDINKAVHDITKEAAPNANIIWGMKLDPELEDSIEITVIATKGGGAGVPFYMMTEAGQAEAEQAAAAEAAPAVVPPVVTPEPTPVAPQPQAIQTPVAQPAAPAEPVAPVAAPAAAPTATPRVVINDVNTAPQNRDSGFYGELDFKILQEIAMGRGNKNN